MQEKTVGILISILKPLTTHNINFKTPLTTHKVIKIVW